MAEKSRIRFNPGTKEIEIEGSESFVKIYFGKIQAILSGASEKKAPVKRKSKAAKPAPAKADKKKPKAVKARPRKKAKKVRQSKIAPKVIAGTRRGALSKTVLTLIRNSAEGVSAAQLKEKTGLQDRQIWNIITSAKKKGTIKQVKRGVYGAVAAAQE